MSSRTPHRSVAERVGDVERGAHRVVLEVDEHHDVHLRREGWANEVAARRARVAAVGGDQAVRHGADAAAAPPRGLRVGRDADGAGDVRGVAVAGLHAVVIDGAPGSRGSACRWRQPRPRARCARSACGARARRGRRSRGGRRASSRPRSSARSPRARSRRRRTARAPRAASKPGTHSPSAASRPEHSRRTAIASSMPPSTEWWRWNTCISDAADGARRARAPAS